MKIFDAVQFRIPKKNTFDLSHERKQSMNMGLLYPNLVQEVLPGDFWSVKTENFFRFQPMIYPLMHRVNVYTHYFFVPNRILWDNWESFITGGDLGDDSSVPPYLEIDSGNQSKAAKNMILDYLGLPLADGLTLGDAQRVSALPLHAYWQIYNDYYVDPNVGTQIDFDKGDGDVTSTWENSHWQPLQRCWEKDYFTAALSNSQRGDEVTMPFSPVYKDISTLHDTSGNQISTGDGTIEQSSASGGSLFIRNNSDALEIGQLQNLEDSAGVTIRDLRNAMSLQKWMEKSARVGWRYKEHLMAFFGVKGGDARLQRAEYLGGGMQPVSISEVANTNGVVNTTSGYGDVQGALAGYGISAGQTNGFKKKFTEHGFIIGIVSIMPKTAYYHGINKLWSRNARTDYYFPEFAHIGEQAILNKEVYWDGTASADDATFGYIPRFSEYKFNVDSIHGDFRDSLEFAHLGRKFNGTQNLNETFMECNPADRIWAVSNLLGDNVDHILGQIYHKIKASRPIPYFSNPRM